MNHEAEPSTTKRAYTGLADYAAEHHVPVEPFQRYGWHDTFHNRRPALAIPTDSGERYRYIDGRGSYINIPGYKPCLYGLSKALEIHAKTGLSLVFCNGEASTVTAQHYGLPAFTHTAGEGTRLTDEQLKQLQACYSGPVIVALDSDPTGREGAAKMVLQLQGAGYDARAVDLGGHDGCDLADFAGQHQHDAAAALASCPVLQVEAPLRGQVDHPTPQPTGPKTPLESEQEARALELYVQSAIRGEAAILAKKTGGRNKQLNEFAFVCGTFAGADWVQRHWIDEAEAERLARQACDDNGYITKDGEGEFVRTFRSGFKGGLAKPRPKPLEREAYTPRGRLSQRFAGKAGEAQPVDAATVMPFERPAPPRPTPDAATAVEADALTTALLERIAKLEAENIRLREALESSDEYTAQLEAERDEVKAILRHPQYDFKTRVTLGCIRLDQRAQPGEGGQRAIPASSYRQMSERYNIKVSSLQNAVQPLKQAGVLKTKETMIVHRDGELLDHPITEDVTLLYEPGALLYRGPLPTTKRTAANRARSEVVRKLAEIGKAAQEAVCPECQQTGCMHLYCSTHEKVIRYETIEEARNQLDLAETLEASAEPPSKVDQPKDKDCLANFTSPPTATTLSTSDKPRRNNPDPHNLARGKEHLDRGEFAEALECFDRLTDAHKRGEMIRETNAKRVEAMRSAGAMVAAD